MRKLLVKNIGLLSSGYFALTGIVFLSIIFSAHTTAGIVTGLVLFAIAVSPLVIRYKMFRLVYGFLAFMVSFCILIAFLCQSVQWSAKELLSFVALSIIFTGYLGASIGLIYAALQSSDPKRFTLI